MTTEFGIGTTLAATYVIPGTPIIKQIQGRLFPYLGAGARYLDLSRDIYWMAENCFYGNVFAAREPLIKSLMAYSDKLPQAEVEDIVEEAIDFIKRYIWAMVKENADDWSWHFDLTPRGDIKLLQLARCRPHNPNSHVDLLRKEVESSLENGDWVSSSIREFLRI